MMDDKLKSIDEEDFIFIVFIVLFLVKMYSNKVEREYRIRNDEKCRKRYHHINEIAFGISIIIYAYIVYSNYKTEDCDKLVLIANGLSLIVLLIFLYLEIICDD